MTASPTRARTRVLRLPLVVAALSAASLLYAAQEPESSGAEATQAPAAPATLPPDIQWETNYEDPPIGSPDAIRGGTFNYYILAYPLTFRLMGPNSNDAFANWNILFTAKFPLVRRHPVTDNFIPWMATHWSIQDDQRTIYFRLDPDARFSDGEPVTADDYVFTWQMMQSEHIVDPYYNSFAEQRYESVARIDDYTLRIVGKYPSWRPLFDFAEEFWPTPSHATVLDSGWVDRTTNDFQIVHGPYVVSEVSRGESVTFERVPGWWGDGKHYFQGMFNFDRIHLKVIPDERKIDYLRRGELDLVDERTARTWNEEYVFPAVRNGWLHRARVMTDMPSGLYGMYLNLEAPIFQNKDFRKAMQHLFNFERLNRNLMFDEYFRQVSFFEGSQYANPDLQPYAFDPLKAREYLERAGYRRPSERGSPNLLSSLWNVTRGLLFTRSGSDEILVNDRGEPARFSVSFGSKGLERHLTVMQQEYRRAGIDMRLRLLEPGTAFERLIERKYEAHVSAWTTSFYPAAREYLHSEFTESVNNNNIWGFGSEEVDDLIRIYEEDLDPEARQRAMHRIDEIVHDEAFYVPFWDAPYIRVAYWDYVVFPEFYLPRRTYQIIDYLVYWIDPERKAALDEAMRTGTPYPLDDELDKDYYGIRSGASAPQ